MVSFFLGHSVYISIIYIVIVHRSTFTHSYLCVCLLPNFQLWKRLRNKFKRDKKRWDRQCLNPKKKNISKKEKHKTDIHKKNICKARFYETRILYWRSSDIASEIIFAIPRFAISEICKFWDLQISKLKFRVPRSDFSFFCSVFLYVPAKATSHLCRVTAEWLLILTTSDERFCNNIVNRKLKDNFCLQSYCMYASILTLLMTLM